MIVIIVIIRVESALDQEPPHSSENKEVGPAFSPAVLPPRIGAGAGVGAGAEAEAEVAAVAPSALASATAAWPPPPIDPLFKNKPRKSWRLHPERKFRGGRPRERPPRKLQVVDLR